MKLSPRFIQYGFFVLFALSVLVAFLVINNQERVTKFTMAESIETGEPVIIEELIPEKPINLTTSTVSMLVTLLGFVVTTVINVRKDWREARASELALKQKEVELQHAQIELEELKKKVA
jgi:cell division protein FtsX